MFFSLCNKAKQVCQEAVLNGFDWAGYILAMTGENILKCFQAEYFGNSAIDIWFANNVY